MPRKHNPDGILIQGLASLSSPEKEFGTGSSVGSKIQEFKEKADPVNPVNPV